MTLDQFDLTSMTGILLATMFILELIKRTLGNKTWFNVIPVFIYASVIACILAIIASKVLHSMDGEWWVLAWKAGISALASSGFYEWLRNGKNSLGSTTELK